MRNKRLIYNRKLRARRAEQDAEVIEPEMPLERAAAGFVVEDAGMLVELRQRRDTEDHPSP